MTTATTHTIDAERLLLAASHQRAAAMHWAFAGTLRRDFTIYRNAASDHYRCARLIMGVEE